ncbi:Pyrophosphate--fructose 6-phosphate 1-phosphotransferase [Seminavis robusta]|uniref:Pyrophosphate--fructose 6-phosphate 1-phosphotransferase n=1 Tax=Seminavis robusta TaxID=568900 RepID=A0A9N8DGF0_9STRA|nr:Pyrophosphate--fructose 6-phosphate 1-phosphotransferase [Seminavis robusta]|eukprot:Sro132_g062670.1 Pyrophosphate--fructose 6-phosphate 1-phosphotransferase (419) ;mRNA; f:71823-73381
MTDSSSSLAGKHVYVAMLTAGGLAPCLSSSIAQLSVYWIAALKEGKISGLTLRMYRAGYKGLLTGDSFVLDEKEWEDIESLNFLGGSPIGNSRVKLTNEKDCIAKGYVKEGDTPLEVASQQLLKDKVHVLHTIGGDDTNTQAASLSKYLFEKHHGKVVVVGMPKTIDNDVYPIVQTFGANTAAIQGAQFFANVVNEATANPRMLVLHEVMGRDSGYLTAATAAEYRKILAAQTFPASTAFKFCVRNSRDIHAIWIPEIQLDLLAEGARLKKLMDEYGCINVFFGEGTGVQEIVKDMEANGEEVPRDAFGHVSLAKINPGKYFSTHLAKAIEADKVIVQKSGYFARSAAANEFDRDLIGKCAEVGVQCAIDGVSGCMGQDEDKEGTPIRAIEFERIKGGKPFDIKQDWFQQMLTEIGQV